MPLPITVHLAVHALGCNFAFYEGDSSAPYALGQWPAAEAPILAARLAAMPEITAVKHRGLIGDHGGKFTADLPKDKAAALAAAWRESPPARPFLAGRERAKPEADGAGAVS